MPAQGRDLAHELAGHDIKTVPQAGWASLSNGKLLRAIAASGKFNLFLTMDKNLPYQHRISKLPFAIVIFRAKSNRLEDVAPLARTLLDRLSEFKPGNCYVLKSIT